MRRAVALWLVLFGAYCATLGIHASKGERYTAAEAHVLLTTRSLVDDGDFDLSNQYRDRDWRSYFHGPLLPTAAKTNGRLVEPPAAGFPLLLAPAMGLGGPTLVELWCAALVALGFVLAAMLARELVPDPWGWWAALIMGLSPPVLAAATRVSPELIGATILTGAVVLALRAREDATRRTAFGCALLLAVAPWIALELALPAAAIALALAHWLRRTHRGVAGFVALEVVLTSLVLFVTINGRLYGGLTPYAAGPAGGPTRLHTPLDVLARAPRIVGVLLDRDVGLLRWAPFAALGFVALWLLWRSRRDRLATALPEQMHVEAAAGLVVVVCAAVLLVAIFIAPALHGATLAARHVLPMLGVLTALCAWALRFAPRAGGALAALTLAGSAWLLTAARSDSSASIAPAHGPLPWGGIERALLARFDGGNPSAGQIVWLAVAGVVIAAAVLGDQRMRRDQRRSADARISGAVRGNSAVFREDL